MSQRIFQCSSPVIALESEKTVQDALDLMTKEKIRRIVIAHKVYPVGIVTERDIAKFLENDAEKRLASQIKLSEVMNRNVIKIISNKENFLLECARLMTDLNIGSVVVVDSDNQIVGITTKTTFVKNYPLFYEGKYKVQDHMTRAIISCRADDSLTFAFRIMNNNLVSRLVVTNYLGEPVGTLTFSSIIQKNETVRGQLNKDVREFFVYPSLRDVRVSDVMDRVVFNIKPDDDLAKATKMMEKYHLSGVPIIDDELVLAGIVSSTDITRIFANS